LTSLSRPDITAKVLPFALKLGEVGEKVEQALTVKAAKTIRKTRNEHIFPPI
jgi:hypothetical protein